MTTRREERPAKKMKPMFLVFCEGETEEKYLDFLRREYKSPIKIIVKKEGARISQHLIDSRKKELKISSRDCVKTFLLYDLDVVAINQKLKNCKATFLCSNPCIELWFLLHCKNQSSFIQTNKCIDELTKMGNVWQNYKKPNLTETPKKYLWDKKFEALTRAKILTEGANPSSAVYKILEQLEENRNK